MAEGPAEAALSVLGSPAPSYSAPQRAKLMNVAFSATRAPVWSRQVGPAARVEDFSVDQRLANWWLSDRGSNGWWAENDWRADHVRGSEDGIELVLERSRIEGAAPMSSGEIIHGETFQYGYFETRMRAARGEGIVTGFFTFARDGASQKTWNEIDVEILGRSTDRVELTVHAEGRKTHKTVELGFDAADGFHTYGFEWAPDAVRWYIDGVMVHEATGPVVERLRREQKLHVSLTGTRGLEAWAGRLDLDGGPYVMNVACVAYAPSYEGDELCGG